MIKVSKTYITIFFLFIVVAFTGCCFGHGYYHGSGYRGHYRNEGSYAGSNYSAPLSYDEKEAFEKEWESFGVETQGLRAKIDQAEDDLRRELSKSEPSSRKTISLQREIYDLEAQLIKKQEAHMKSLNDRYPNARWDRWGGGYCSYY